MEICIIGLTLPPCDGKYFSNFAFENFHASPPSDGNFHHVFTFYFFNPSLSAFRLARAREFDHRPPARTPFERFDLSYAGCGPYINKFPVFVKKEIETEAVQIARHLEKMSCEKRMRPMKIQWVACISLFIALKMDYSIAEYFERFSGGLQTNTLIRLANKAKDAFLIDPPALVTPVKDPVTIPPIPKTMAELRQILSKRDLEEYEGGPKEGEAGAE